ncbi:TetR/AcrR family transcriptional regulator [Pyruvatibacter sp.]|uniref:TetR/AcrR family transcriptional regulator n=1 Tax=Pyruvatibacter sp. TaxID=1981328 RepID=UPI0032669BB5
MPRVADPKVRRAEVVAAAAALIASEGPEALSMRNIADQAGCTIGLLNHWFKSKDDLIEAVLDQAATAGVDRVKAVVENPDVKLEDVVREFLPLDEERSAELRVWLVFWALSIGRPTLRRGYSQRLRAMREEITREVSERGIVTKDVTQFIDTLMAMLDGISVNAIAEPDYWTIDRQTKTLRWMLKQMAPKALV